MSGEARKHRRQWITLQGASCDVRVGRDVVDIMGTIIKGSVGKPRVCALVSGSTVGDEVVDRVRYQLTDAGFEVVRCTLPSGPAARTMESVSALATALAQARVTADDLVCAVGDVDTLSAVSYVTSTWCGGTILTLVPLDLAGCVEAETVPRGIDVGGESELLACRPAAKHLLCDPSLMDIAPSTPDALRARALMATSAMVDSEKGFGSLWDRAELLAAGDEEALCDQIGDTARSRGRVVSSSSVAVRQSLSFGLSFMRALRPLVPADVADGLLIAEGVRFLSRVSCGMGQLAVDDVLTIDELLDLLELPPIACEVDPERMIEALREERFRRSNRFMLELPRAIGRVRLGSVDDELLREHAGAWCASRAAW